jgi:XapX domain-containing protein
MKGLLTSFVVGLIVGVVYGVIRVKSPAPPIVALLGLLGCILADQNFFNQQPNDSLVFYDAKTFGSTVQASKECLREFLLNAGSSSRV